MTNMKKFLFFGCLIVVALLVVGCKGDTVAPVLAIEDPTITHVVNADVDLLQGITATDNTDSAADIVIEISDLGGYDKDVVGTYEVTVKATDKAGNSVTQTISVTVTEAPIEDTVAPVLTIGTASITHQTNATVDLLEDVTATDDVDAVADITIEVSDFNGYDKSIAGTYVITVKATDKSGNFATGTITVVVKSDVLAPMLTSAVSDVIHIAGETVDLTRGLEGVDNVDGVNVIFTVSDLLSYNKEVPGEYTVEITMSDAAGNEATPFTRNVIVQEGYARAEMTSFEGETIRYEALYNPQVLNGVTGTGYNSAYDGHYVNVLSKDYLEWLLAYAPERIGSGMGWNVIAVTDSSNKIVYVRHWNSGEAYKDEADNLVSIPAVDWCSGTVRTWTETVGEETVGMSNAKYSAGEMGMMMANINKWVPENGHIFIFMNWTTIGKDASNNVIGVANSADMPRSMGARYIMASDENGDDVMDYALGRDLFILNPELSDQAVRTTFDAANPFPIISVPSSRFITANGAWKNDYVNVVYLNEHDALNPFNPLSGITADDGKGTDITANVTYKMYRYQTTTLAYGLQTSLPITDPRWEENLGAENTWKLADNEVTVEQALNPVNDDYYFVVEYQVTANGHTDTAYRLVQIQAETPDYIELYGPTDSVFAETLGMQQRLEMNPNLSNFGAMNATEKGILYTADFFKAQTTLPVLTKGMAVVLDPYFRVQLIRVLNGAAFEMDATGTAKTAELTWTSADMLAGLGDLVPAGGYIVIYPEGLDGAVLLKAMKAFYDYGFVGGEVTDVLPANGGSSVEMIIKEVKEVSTLIVNDVAPLISVNNVSVNIAVIENSKDALVFSSAGGGAGFRLDVGKTYYFTKAQYAVLAANAEVVASFTTGSPNKGTPWFRDGVIIVVDADGKFVLARLMTTSAAAEVKADGTVIFGNAACVAGTEADKAAAEVTAAANLTWDLVIPNAANTIAHGPLADIQSVVPDGGAFFILPGTTSTSVRNYAIKLVWNAAYPGSGVIVDATLPTQPEGAPNPATNGFDAVNMTAAYLAALTFKVQFVSTVTVKAPKIDRPVASIANNILSWGQVEGASSYDVYVDGALAAAGVGDLVPDTTTYNYALRLLNLDGNAHVIQVRAITADPAVGSTSVLSDPVTVQFTALALPENIQLNGTVLSWNPVRYAIGYNIYINDVLFATSLACQFDLVEAFGSSTKYVQIKAIADPNDNVNVASEITEKLPFGEATATYLTLALETQGVTNTTVAEWMAKRNILVANGGFAKSTQIFVIEDAVNFATYATPTGVVTANGTMLLFAANGTLKAVRTIVGKFEWLSTNDPLVTNGWRAVDTYTAGTVRVSELAGLVAAGDYIILSNNETTKQAGAQLNPRDFLAYHFQGSWTLGSTEAWRGTIETFINPAGVSYSLSTYPVTSFMALTLETQHVTYTTVAEWMAKRNILVANGGFAKSTEIFYIEDAVNFATYATPTNVVTANGTFLLFAANGTLKAVRTIVGKYEWLSTNDPLVTNGWRVVDTYTAGTVRVSELAGLVAEGDYIILSNNETTKQTGAQLNPRDFLAYHFQGSWTLGSTEAWRGTIETFINPSTTVYSVLSLPYKNVLSLALEDQGVTYTTIDEWMAKRNILVANGGFAGSTEIFCIEDAVNFATYATPTGVVTANGTFLLFAANGTLKAVRTIVGKFEWLSTNDPLVTNGWRAVDTYTAGTVRVSELAGLVAAGDYIILSNNETTKQAGAQLNPRDFLAYHFQGSWTLGSTEAWRGTIETFINPATVAKTLKKVIITF